MQIPGGQDLSTLVQEDWETIDLREGGCLFEPSIEDWDGFRFGSCFFSEDWDGFRFDSYFFSEGGYFRWLYFFLSD